MFTSSELLEKINAALEALPYERTPQSLYTPIRYVLSMGGKRVRPVLMLMAYNLYQDEVEPAMMPALGLETYHNFTLMHDDLTDRADYRRGKPCVHKVWGDDAAIWSGDTMLLLAIRRVAESHNPRIMQLFTETAMQVNEGQQLDMEFERRNDVSEAEYMEMIRLKTSVLLACALKMGAMLADAPETDQAALYDFGEKLGLAFQLQDDYLDVYGDFKTFGKLPGGDILCNKKTFMLINALLKATPEQQGKLKHWLEATEYDPQQKIREVTELYSQIGVDRMARERMNECFAQAHESLAHVGLTEERKQILWQYALGMMNRQS